MEKPSLPPGSSQIVLSVVIPTRDTRDLTIRCLETLRPGAPETEILVIDDGSRDGTAALIRDRFPGVQILENSEPRGFTRSANRGLESAQGRIRLLLNSDTETGSGLLDHLMDAFSADPELGIAGCELSYPDGRPQWSGGSEPTLIWLFALASALPSFLDRFPGYRRLRPAKTSKRGGIEWVSGCALAVREEVLESIGSLDERFSLYAQDLDFCSRARREGWKVALVPECQVVHHHGATIGGLPGSFRKLENPERLWVDLLRWIEKHRGISSARRARNTMRIGAASRILMRRLAMPFVPRSRQVSWREDTECLSHALQSLGASDWQYR